MILLQHIDEQVNFLSPGVTNEQDIMMRESKFPFDRSLIEFGLPSSGPDWLSNGDILALTEDDPGGHVPR